MMHMAIEIRQDDLSGEQIKARLRLHLDGMHRSSPQGHVFALDLSGLKSPGVTVWSAWVNARIAGVGALKELGHGEGEVKSMRTHPDFLRRGVAAAVLERIITEARKRGMQRLSLETGRGPAFEPALKLYRKRGFVDCEPFAGYARSDFNQFLNLSL